MQHLHFGKVRLCSFNGWLLYCHHLQLGPAIFSLSNRTDGTATPVVSASQSFTLHRKWYDLSDTLEWRLEVVIQALQTHDYPTDEDPPLGALSEDRITTKSDVISSLRSRVLAPSFPAAFSRPLYLWHGLL